jgi:hypothetical protein
VARQGSAKPFTLVRIQLGTPLKAYRPASRSMTSLSSGGQHAPCQSALSLAWRLIGFFIDLKRKRLTSPANLSLLKYKLNCYESIVHTFKNALLFF